MDTERAFLTNLDGGLVLAAEPQAGSEVQRALREFGSRSGVKHSNSLPFSDRVEQVLKLRMTVRHHKVKYPI